MATVNVSEAARLAKTTRATIYKYIKSGKLSAEKLPNDSGYTIDTAELLRVFGAMYTPPIQQDTPNLQQEIDVLREQVKAKEELLAEKDRRIGDLQQSIRMLEHKMEIPVVDTSGLEVKIKELEAELTREKGKGFFARLFGKK